MDMAWLRCTPNKSALLRHTRNAVSMLDSMRHELFVGNVRGSALIVTDGGALQARGRGGSSERGRAVEVHDHLVLLVLESVAVLAKAAVLQIPRYSPTLLVKC